MEAVILTSIPEQNLELIRNRIGEILTIEFAKQFALNPAYPKITKVWIERFMPFNSQTELPAINVTVYRGDSTSKSALLSKYDYIYYIDVYTKAPGTSTEGGDSLAMKNMTKIAGMIRTILECPDYKTLAFNAGIIATTLFQTFIVGDKSKMADALSDVVGRCIFMVNAKENNIVPDSGATITQSNTHVKLDVSDQGMFYEYVL